MKYFFIFLTVIGIPFTLLPKQIPGTIMIVDSRPAASGGISGDLDSDKITLHVASNKEFTSGYDSGGRGKIIRTSRNGKWGYVDENGSTVIPFQYDEAEDFRSSGNKFMAKVRIRDYWMFIDRH